MIQAHLAPHIKLLLFLMLYIDYTENVELWTEWTKTFKYKITKNQISFSCNKQEATTY